jgi:hypothetical protein
MNANHLRPLEHYDAERFGPILGVSDVGSGVAEIVRAADASAKAAAACTRAPDVVGVIVDGERMTSGGEAPIGPDQYAAIIAASAGRVYNTTNVSIRVSARNDLPFPEVEVAGKPSKGVDAIAAEVKGLFSHFVHTPDGKPRPLLVRLRVPAGADASVLDTVRQVVAAIDTARRDHQLGPANVHRVGLLVIYDDRIDSADLDFIKQLITLAKDLHLPQVAVDGDLVPAARAHMGVQGVLNVLPPDEANQLLGYATQCGVELAPRYTYDEMSSAVGVWAEMSAAQHYGFAGAKYGLTPLTFAEQTNVVTAVQNWVTGLTAIPAFYADTPFVSDTEIILSDAAANALRIWLDMVAAHGTRVVLVDCPDHMLPRIDPEAPTSPRKLLHSSQTDPSGVFTVAQIAELHSYAKQLGIRILWSGGIPAQGAFDLGRQQVFGIFSTSSTAHLVAVGGVLASDPQLPAEDEPTFEGVRRIHALLQAGFLCAVLNDSTLVDTIDAAAQSVIATPPADNTLPDLLAVLDTALTTGWKTHWKALDR